MRRKAGLFSGTFMATFSGSMRRNVLAAVATYVGIVGNNTLLPVTTLAIASTSVAQLTVHQSAVALADFKVGLAKAYFTGNFLRLTPLPNGYTVNEISIRLVSGGPVVKLTKAASTTWTVAAWDGTRGGSTVDWSDLTSLGFTIPANTPFYVFQSITPTGGTALPSHQSSGPAMFYIDEALQNSVSSPTTFTTSVTDTDANHRTRMAAMVGMVGTRTGDVYAIQGDSQVAMNSSNYAISDGQIPSHNRGDLPYTVAAAGWDYVNLGIGGDQWETRLYDFKMQSELIAYTTGVITELGINSYNNKGQSTATVPLAWAQAGLPLFKGRKLWAATTTPQTTGIWTAADGSDQTLKSYSTTLDAYNAGLTFSGLLPSPINRYAALQGVTDKWVANGTAKYSTVDGLHVSKAGVTTIVPGAVQSTVASTLPILPVVNPAAPSIALTGTGTWAGGFLTNGTLINNAILPGQAVHTILMKVTLGASLASALNILPSSTAGPWTKQVQITTAGKVAVTNQAVATITSTTALNFSAENEIMFALDGTNIYLFINGVFDSSEAIGGNATIRPDFALVTTSASGVKVRELTIWDYCRQTSGSYTPVTFTGSETGCVGRWPLATDASGIIGPARPQ